MADGGVLFFVEGSSPMYTATSALVPLDKGYPGLGALDPTWVKRSWQRLWSRAATSHPWQFGGWLWGTWRAGLQDYVDCWYVRTVDAAGTGLIQCYKGGKYSDLSPGQVVNPLVNPRYRPLHVWQGAKHGWYFDGWLWTDDPKAAALRHLPQFASVAHLGA